VDGFWETDGYNQVPMPQIFENSYVISKKYETTSVLSSTSILLSLKNDLKIFLPMKTYEKGRPIFKWSFLELTTL